MTNFVVLTVCNKFDRHYQPIYYNDITHKKRPILIMSMEQDFGVNIVISNAREVVRPN